MKALAAVALALAAAAAPAERILLVPLDSRPAAGQFAQMIAKMAAVEVVMPPYEMLGRFTNPGTPEAILGWLEEQDYKDVTSVVVSADMIAYGGLIASRVNDVEPFAAVQRLKRLARLRSKKPDLKIYVFTAIMRLAPTATRASAAWRMQLGRLAELQDEYRRTKNPARLASIKNLQLKIPPLEVDRYEQTRERNHTVQRSLLYLTEQGAYDYLVLGQDDARPYGPHVPETERLKRVVAKLKVEPKVYFCEGIDQHANVLVSRALLKQHGWTPKVRIVYSDELGKLRYANYESKPIQASLRDQIVASGAEPMDADGAHDYSLFLNTPGRREEPFRAFQEQLSAEVDQGFPVSVADINLGRDGTADPELFEMLWRNNRMMRLLSYAGWNTAGNTMGTAIPAANVYLLSRRTMVDPLLREVAQREFLLHRFVNDFAYHKYTRPQAYAMIDASPRASREETYGQDFVDVDDFVRRDLAKHLEQYFREQFMGRRFFAGTSQFFFSGITGVRVFLPWPRAYEVRLEFQLQAQPVAPGPSGPVP